MKNDLFVNNEVTIPESELEITTSRAGGPGGQHVNKTETRITVRWNVKKTLALNEEQKERVLKNLQSRLTDDGDLIIHSGSFRSQQQNKKAALAALAIEIKKALFVPKKRLKTKVSQAAKQARHKIKKERSLVKKMRSKKSYEE